MRTFFYLFRFYRKSGHRFVPAVKRAARVFKTGF